MSLISFISSLVIGGIAILLWWPLAWDWDSDGFSIPAYIDMIVVIVSAVTGVLSGIVMIISAAKAVCHMNEKPSKSLLATRDGSSSVIADQII